MHTIGLPPRVLFAGLAVLTVFGSANAAPPAGETIRLWSGKAPGEQGNIAAEKQDVTGDGAIGRVTNISEPTLSLYRPEHPNGVSIIIAPGGAYQFLSWDHEGVQVARKFNQAGVTAFVLKYRVPTRSFDPENKLALMDAQRSVSLVRSRAGEWGLKPDRVGFLGFSAGGHLAANISNNFAQRAYDAADDVDKTSARPDFAILIYPGGMLEKGSTTQLIPRMQPTASTPPSFVAVASDDKGSFPASLAYWEAVRGAGVKNELHVYASGGHGFGMRPSAGAASTWPDRAIEWMRGIGVLPASGAQ